MAIAMANLVPSPTGHSPAFLFHGQSDYAGTGVAVARSKPGIQDTGTSSPYRHTARASCLALSTIYAPNLSIKYAILSNHYV